MRIFSEAPTTFNRLYLAVRNLSWRAKHQQGISFHRTNVEQSSSFATLLCISSLLLPQILAPGHAKNTGTLRLYSFHCSSSPHFFSADFSSNGTPLAWVSSTYSKSGDKSTV